MKAAGHFQVVILRARAAAQGLEVKPDYPAGLAPGTYLPRLNIQHRVFVSLFSQTFESVCHGSVGRLTQWHVIELELL